ncbi:hypothetical protein NX059_007326 [Plenodomus lindquistii]|nr:hypothetical protein NX059_007326 [Plenodomus lindquistii]
MNHIRATHRIQRAFPAPRRIQQHGSKRTYAAEPASPHPPSTPPNPNNTPPSRTGTYYKSFGSPMLKCFLGALFTYQLAYYGWMKLEAIEEAHDKQTEIAGLQQELRTAVESQQRRLESTVGKVEEGVKEAKDKVVEGVKATGAVREVAKGGWWPW